MADNSIRGNVFIEDGNPPVADYTPARKVNVTIAFDAFNPSELQSMLDLAGTLARTKVDEMLGRTAPSGGQGNELLGEPAAKTRRPRAAKEAGATASQSADKPSTSALEIDDGPQEAASPAQSDTSRDRGEKTVADVGRELDNFDVEDDFDAVVEVTDDQLNAAAQAANGRIKDAPRIKSLVATYNPDPTKSFQLRQIPQAQRQDFLDKLTALK